MVKSSYKTQALVGWLVFFLASVCFELTGGGGEKTQK